MMTIFLLPASVVAELAPALARHVAPAAALPSPIPVPYWKRMMLSVRQTATQPWGHVRLHP